MRRPGLRCDRHTNVGCPLLVERFGVFATPLVPRAILQVVLIALCVVCAL